MKEFGIFFVVDKFKTYLRMLSIRQNIVLLGLLIIAAAIVATIYLTLGQQEIRKRAQVEPTPTITPILTPIATPSATPIPSTCGPNDCQPICAVNAVCAQTPNVATRQCTCQIPQSPTPTPTTIPDTCGPADCQTCAQGATCKQVAGMSTRQCSCQFPVVPTPTPITIPDTCSASDCQTCAQGAVCRQVSGFAHKVCTCQVPPPAFQLFLSLNLGGFGGGYVPKRTSESVVVDLYSPVATISGKQGTVVYSPVSRHFEGNITLGDNIPAGDYQLFVKGASFLSLGVGVISIQGPGVTFVPFLPNRPLLSCDLNNDNVINILDIGQIYTDIRKTFVSNSLADIDRDGDVDIFDHNFCVGNFLKEGEKPLP